MSTQTNPYVRTDVKASDVSDKQNAALRGAALAFAKPPVKPKPNDYRGNSGALAAATKAGSNTNAPRSSPVPSPDRKGKEVRLISQYGGAGSIYGSRGSGSDLAVRRQNMSLLVQGDASNLLLMPSITSSRSVSPSQIAASLAASRSAPITPNHTGQQPLRPQVLHRKTSSSGRSPRRSISLSRGVTEDVLDTSSIPPTTSLIGMFERSAVSTSVGKEPKFNAAIQTSNTNTLISPKSILPKPVVTEQSPTNFTKPTVPPLRDIGGRRTPRPSSRGRRTPIERADVDKSSSDDSFVSASDQRPQSAPDRKRRLTSIPASADARKIDALANAIVASSIASSRAASPAKPTQSLAPPVLPPRRGNNGSYSQQSKLSSRTPSPAKGFRQTMRKPPKDEEEEDPNMLRKGKKNIMKKHPNKHHEGDRKRWRDAITERERKRYEAVWASNKGLHIYPDQASIPARPGPELQANVQSPSDPSHSVSNLVVRDIWSRSRLGTDVLSEVWELVNRTGTSMLSREEFVVGLWLIDQRLKGRKLPVRVGSSVWSSIAISGGIKVRGNGRTR